VKIIWEKSPERRFREKRSGRCTALEGELVERETGEGGGEGEKGGEAETLPAGQKKPLTVT